ncbi:MULTISPECIES: molecular chaperone HtpG [Exiguobacterium]|uniref:Chaperone protein HtpG n=2 Tax=Exiguobacterium antarcticum TaxID=132920 RepID=A0ABT6R0Y6_9BACL|nr:MULTISPECIES: molecular chaperone HtpG [Exiguobacterium]MDI3234608.1 molecular chaperone HtpG [Exiguobacterium antarcticum]
METKQFKAESKRLLEMMIHSIYTHKEIFLRELISNASDAMDKIYYKALTDETMTFDKEAYKITIEPNKETRQLILRDTGIGMTKEELEENLGTIAKSGSLAFKAENESKDGHDIIGQFGVGFYSAFMVADTVTVVTKPFGSDVAYKWESHGIDGYTIEEVDKETVGTDITLHIKANEEEENYDEYLEPYRLRSIIKKYSDFIRYPIEMEETEQRPVEGSDETEDVTVMKTVNSMIPIWRKNKRELTDEDYVNFYQEKRYGFDTPVKHIHISADGAVRYQSILFIPEQPSFDYYSKEFEKGLELYANGVLIMEKCSDLLPDHFSFVKGMVDSEDLSLNISREMLQHDRQLKLIAKNIQSKIKTQLEALLRDDREKYETFYQAFGRQLKFGIYNDYGMHKDSVKELVLFHSAKEKKLVTLAEYVAAMPEEQKYIYYASGESTDRLDKLPQSELVKDKGFDILYFTEEIDEFAIQMLLNYDGKEFKSVTSSDLGIEQTDQAETTETQVEMFTAMQDVLAGQVKEVKASSRLKSHPVCFATDGAVSIEMEKILKAMPNNQDVAAVKILELNTSHDVFKAIEAAYAADRPKFERYTKLMYQQALLMEGLPIEDPVAFANEVCALMV